MGDIRCVRCHRKLKSSRSILMRMGPSCEIKYLKEQEKKQISIEEILNLQKKDYKVVI